jgi:hypothetical protein
MNRTTVALSALLALLIMPVIGQDGVSTSSIPRADSLAKPSVTTRNTAGRVDLAGEVVAPKGDLTLRAEPPGTFFQAKGAAVGTVSPSESYRVLEERTVPTILGTEQWLKVQSTKEPSREGWIYNGDGTRAINVQIAK